MEENFNKRYQHDNQSSYITSLIDSFLVVHMAKTQDKSSRQKNGTIVANNIDTAGDSMLFVSWNWSTVVIYQFLT